MASPPRFSIYNRQKGAFFDDHEQDDVTVYQPELLEKLAKLDATTITTISKY